MWRRITCARVHCDAIWHSAVFCALTFHIVPFSRHLFLLPVRFLHHSLRKQNVFIFIWSPPRLCYQQPIDARASAMLTKILQMFWAKEEEESSLMQLLKSDNVTLEAVLLNEFVVQDSRYGKPELVL